MLAKSSILLAVFMFVGISLLAPVSADATETHISSAGCKTEYFLLKDLATEYNKKTGTKLRTASTGNKKAMDLMISNDIDFAFTCKPVGKIAKKLKLDPEKVGDWKSLPIAKDPIVVVSNVENGANNLSVDQLTGIFTGKITNWGAVGGADLPINVAYINTELESGSLLLFKEFTVGLNGELMSGAKTLDAPERLGNYVSRTPGGVTFMPLNSYMNNHGSILAINGVLPSNHSIEDGSYQLAATYYLTVRSEKNQAVDDFIAYCMSDEGQQVIARNFVPYSK